MEKKELQNNNKVAQVAVAKTRTFFSLFLLVLKLLLAAFSIPLIIGITIGFNQRVVTLEPKTLEYFIAGIIAYLIMHLAIYKPKSFYAKGQRILQILFKFFAPLVNVAGYLLPIYSILIFVAYLIFSSGYYIDLDLVIFLIAFSFTMHLVMTAESLREKYTGLNKANYFFGFAIIYILNILMLAAALHFIFKQFSFLDFLNLSVKESWQIYAKVFNQLFM
jgi:hypothetical protein